MLRGAVASHELSVASLASMLHAEACVFGVSLFAATCAEAPAFGSLTATIRVTPPDIVPMRAFSNALSPKTLGADLRS